ncbi:hypothetical protein [Methylobacterium sp.]|uniref:hypothetical protein n=1 Tax=Methylobacterium sp. TaxID=409 RepID=UPI000C6BA83E|nr:hypothetical protein [Methylobacterium sp.]MBP30407.1 hypothetical protein [Methylobacterium sp.]
MTPDERRAHQILHEISRVKLQLAELEDELWVIRERSRGEPVSTPAVAAVTTPETTAERCQAEVLRRDTYRVSRGTRSGFRMHYERCQCSRQAVEDGLCRQHAEVAKARWLPRWA